MEKTKVKLIIASTFIDSIPFNYCDEYQEITRVIVDDHSPWEEIDTEDFYVLKNFVEEYNRNKKNKGSFAFIIQPLRQIPAQQAIDEIVRIRNERLEMARIEREKSEKERERKRQEREMKKLAKTKEEKRKLLEKLKEELGES
jgi:hypothetical protein